MSGSETTVRRQVVTASLWVTAGMLLGRLAGIAREFLIADTFGVTRDADVAILLVTGPDVLVNVAGSGAVGLVLIPILLQHDTGAQLRLVRRLTIRLGVAAMLLSLLVAGLVIALSSGWATEGDLSNPQFRYAVTVTAVAVPLSMLVVITAAFLRAQNRFAAVSLATVTFTAPILVAVAVFRSVIGVAVGIAIGATLRYAVQVMLIARRWRRAASIDEVDVEIRRDQIASSFGVSVLQAAQVSLPIILVTALGDAGDVALLSYGWRILLIPIGLLASVFSVAAYPTLVRMLNDPAQQAQHTVSPIVRPVILMSVVVCVWLWVNATNAIASVYGPAGLDDAAIAEIASAIRAGAVSIPLLTIGTAATTLLFGVQRLRLALWPYALATALLLVAGVMGFGFDGPRGIFFAITLYGAVFGISATVLLQRAQELLLVSLADVLTAMAVAAAGTGVAAGIRAALPGNRIAEVALNGMLFVGCCAAAYALVDKTRKSGAAAGDRL